MKARADAALLALVLVAGTALPAAAHGRHHFRRAVITVHRHVVRAYAVRSRRFVDPLAVANSTRPPPLAVRCAYPLYGEAYPPSAFLSTCTEYSPPPGRERVLHRAVYWTGVHYFAEFPGRTEAGFYPRPVPHRLSEVHRAIVLHARY
jgi:hypothetical protein